MSQIPASLLTLIAGIVITLFSIWIGLNHGLLPEQVSEQAPLVDNLFSIMLAIAFAFFLVVQGAILIFIVKYRRRAGDDTDGVYIEGNFPLEIVWTAIPALIVIGLGIYSVDVYQRMGGFAPSTGMMAHSHPSSHVAQMSRSAMAAPLMVADAEAVSPEASASESEESATPTGSEAPKVVETYKLPIYGFGAPPEVKKPADVTVNVMGLQFAWIFTYPDSGITTSELHIPVGKDIQLNITAQDVIHSFWVPQFRLKQDALPGEKSQLNFVATKTGTYPVICAELCGSYHGSMRTQVIIHTPEEYQQWLEETKVAQAGNLNQAVATKPAELSPSEFLAPYAQEMGIRAETLKQLHPQHPSS
ncbi:MAG: cytochrome c oxidase subunit II [Leptolyngbyaceae cyanobacterium HOT.MB2.61]|nr:cytochrome c oxidase subunit II [Leptolyngbyaceae cyanobacterium HOT.MB2.61]